MVGWRKLFGELARHSNPADITDSDKGMPTPTSSYSVDLFPSKSLAMLRTEHVANVFMGGLSQTPSVESADKKKSFKEERKKEKV